ncbi:MAG TPA: hypothetical protein VJR70_01575, partial [Stellaceae bacterium]|nr:hypothetical protein [Stellaceae bacterium]
MPMLAVILAACEPTIETWRSMSGIAKNDPDPQTAPFTKNMTAALAEPYPNLATVPPPPNRATTAAEREKLTQSLVSDRSATTAEGLPAPAPQSPPAAPPGNSGPPPPAATAE